MSSVRTGLLRGVSLHPSGLVLAAVYAIACLASRQLSLDQFFLPAGIRVAALVALPTRLWPYLLLGDYAYFAQLRVPTVDQYGLAWVLLSSSLLMPTAMLVVHLHRCRAATETTSGLWLLSLSASSALTSTVLNLGLAQLLRAQPAPDTLLQSPARIVFGQFATIITLAPLALLWQQRRADSQWTTRLAIPTAAAVALMLALGLCMQLTAPASHGLRTCMVLLATLPAIALTFMHGWRGAAIAIPLLSLPLHAATPSSGLPASFDAGTFLTQQNMLVMSVALLALGSSITYHQQRSRARLHRETSALHLARSADQNRERELRERATRLKQLGENMDSSLDELADWLHSQGHHAIASSLRHASRVHSRQFRAQASQVYPSALEQVGLYVALQAGGVRDAWHETHRISALRLAGNPCLMSVDLQLASYRSLVEAVSLLLERESGQLCVHTRCGRLRGQQGIVMIVGLLDRDRSLHTMTTAHAFERLAGRVLAYGGSVQCRRNRLRLVLREPATCAQSAA